MAGYIDTGYILPSDQQWTLIEVADDTHYVHVYDGNNSLTTYIN